MAKRIKPVFEDTATTEVKQPELDRSPETESAEDLAVSETAVDDSILPKVGPKSLTEEMIKKLESYDDVVNQNRALLADNAELTDKMSQYITELNELKTSNKQDSELAILKKENRELQDAYDSLLMKISELSFENAKLTSQLQEMSKSTDAQAPAATDAPNTPAPYSDLFNPYQNNGYSAWN